MPLDDGATEIVNVFIEKDAVTDVAEVILTEQVSAVPEQAPDQPENAESARGSALRVTDVPFLKRIPAGLVVTVPLPFPVLPTVSAYSTKSGLPFWVMENVFPSTVMCAVRDPAPGFADRENLIVSLPEPLFIDSMKTQSALVAALH